MSPFYKVVISVPVDLIYFTQMNDIDYGSAQDSNPWYLAHLPNTQAAQPLSFWDCSMLWSLRAGIIVAIADLWRMSWRKCQKLSGSFHYLPINIYLSQPCPTEMLFLSQQHNCALTFYPSEQKDKYLFTKHDNKIRITKFIS